MKTMDEALKELIKTTKADYAKYLDNNHASITELQKRVLLDAFSHGVITATQYHANHPEDLACYLNRSTDPGQSFPNGGDVKRSYMAAALSIPDGQGCCVILFNTQPLDGKPRIRFHSNADQSTTIGVLKRILANIEKPDGDPPIILKA